MATIWTEDFNGFPDGFVLSDSASWTREGTAALEALDGKLYQSAGGGVAGQHARTGVATEDGEYIEWTFDVKSAVGTFGVGVRMTADANSGYFLMHTPTQARLYVRNAGSWTNLQDVSRTLTPGALTLRLKVNGTSGDPVLQPLVNGSNPFGSNYTHDSGTRLTTLGRGGCYSDTNVSATTGIHADFATYEDGSGGGASSSAALTGSPGTLVASSTSAVSSALAATGAPGTLSASSTVALTITSPPLKDNEGNVLASTSLAYVAVYDASTGALVTRQTGLSTDASGILRISHASFVATANAYRVDWETSTGKRRMPLATAA